MTKLGEDTKKINEKERKCLNLLVHGVEEEGWSVFMWYITKETGLTFKEVRRAVRSLAKKGLAKLERGVVDESTGLLAGSGYAATRDGVLFLHGDNPKEEK